jgi:hypothetical protein
MNDLTNILTLDYLTDAQWQHVYTFLDLLIASITTIIQTTCIAPPIPTLSHKTTQQATFHTNYKNDGKNTYPLTMSSRKPYI